LTIVAIAALVVGVLSLLLAILALGRSRGGGRRSARADEGAGAVAGFDPGRLDEFDRQVAAVTRRLEAAEARGERSLHRIGVVRYNPFADTGSNQSFVLAALDAKGDGFVLSSLHSRQQTRVFLKAVAAGKSDSALSEEENDAIKRATEG
jgi:hypothetical protein